MIECLSTCSVIWKKVFRTFKLLSVVLIYIKCVGSFHSLAEHLKEVWSIQCQVTPTNKTVLSDFQQTIVLVTWECCVSYMIDRSQLLIIVVCPLWLPEFFSTVFFLSLLHTEVSQFLSCLLSYLESQYLNQRKWLVAFSNEIVKLVRRCLWQHTKEMYLWSS